MDASEQPASPSLDQYERLAEDILNAYQAGDSEALQRIKDHYGLERLPTQDEFRRYVDQRLSRLPNPENRSATFALADARVLVARDVDFEDWEALAAHIAALNVDGSRVSQFESAVDAVVTGDVTTLQTLLRENPGLIRARSTRLHRATLLHYVSANGVEGFRQKSPKNSVEVAKLLLGAGAEVDAVLADGTSTTLGLVATSVHPLLAGVQIPLLEMLLETGAAVDGAPGGWNTVIAALHNGRGQAAEFLARHGARLDLEAAAGVGRLDVVRGFFNEDGSLNAGATQEQLKDGFAWACEYGRMEVVGFLLQTSIEVNERLKHNGQTGLHWAAYTGHLDTVKLLLDRGAFVNARDETFGGTPLGWAIYGWGEPAPEGERVRSGYGPVNNYYEVVALLIAAGATVEPAWLDEKDRGMPLEEMVRGDPRMLAALGGETPDE